MAAVASNDSLVIPACTEHSQSSLVRRRRGKIINQGYSKEERQDVRREAARAFLLAIPLDTELPATSQSTPTPSVPRPLTINISPQGQSLSTALQFNRDTLQVDSPRRSRRKKLPKKASTSITTTHSIYTLKTYISEPEERRLAFVYGGYPAALYSLVPYHRPQRKARSEQTSTGRVRTNSTSVQVDLAGVNLGEPNMEVSLAQLLEPIWISSDVEMEQVTSPPNRLTKKTPAILTHQNSFRESGLTPTHEGSSKHYRWQFFRDYHAPRYVIVNYDPECLDNTEYFKGRNVTTLNLASYRVSLLKYARENEVKKEVNVQFSEMFPHIKLTLSKLRSIKKDIISVGFESGLDPVATAHALVYFEKLVLMGKVVKSTRKLIAGASLLLAAKFTSDMKRHNIKALIEELIDKFRFSQKELLSYEFPTLLALEFSLLTPVHQVNVYSEKLTYHD